MSGLRGRSAVDVDHRSALPHVPGIPWWGAALVAVALTAIGVAFDAGSGTNALGGVFATCYVLGCVAAVLAVRQSGIFTAVIQPPLILFVAVPFAYFVFHGSTFTGVKDTLINSGYPLIERFPLMFFTSATVLVVGLVRWYLGMTAKRVLPKDDEPTAEASDDVAAAAGKLAAKGRRSTRSSRYTEARAAAADPNDPMADDAPRPPRRTSRTPAARDTPARPRPRSSSPWGTDPVGATPRRSTPPTSHAVAPGRPSRARGNRESDAPCPPRTAGAAHRTATDPNASATNARSGVNAPTPTIVRNGPNGPNGPNDAGRAPPITNRMSRTSRPSAAPTAAAGRITRSPGCGTAGRRTTSCGPNTARSPVGPAIRRPTPGTAS